MKVQFSNDVVFVPAWNGNKELQVAEQISCKLKPLITDDLIKLLDALGDKKEAEANTGLSSKDIAKLISAVGPIVQANVVITGLEDNEGVVDSARMVKYPRYLMLTSEILWKLAEISMPSEAAEKNLEAQPV